MKYCVFVHQVIIQGLFCLENPVTAIICLLSALMHSHIMTEAIRKTSINKFDLLHLMSYIYYHTYQITMALASSIQPPQTYNLIFHQKN